MMPSWPHLTSGVLPASSTVYYKHWKVELEVRRRTYLDSAGGELELELIQSHMAQKPVLRGEAGCAGGYRGKGVDGAHGLVGQERDPLVRLDAEGILRDCHQAQVRMPKHGPAVHWHY